MNFRPLTLADADLLQSHCPLAGTRICDYTPVTMLMWRDFYSIRIAEQDGVLYSKLHDDRGEEHYNIPFATDIPKAVDVLLDAVLPNGGSLKFNTVPPELVPELEKVCSIVKSEELENFSDYLYLAEDLSSLKGKKYGGQRNQISQFKRLVSDWRFEEISPDNISQVRDFFLNDYHPDDNADGYGVEENSKVLEVIDNINLYGVFGGVLFANYRVAGFSLCEYVGDTLDVHIEKADRNLKGAYQMVVNLTAQQYTGDKILYINREEDMGDPGLQASKLSYHPVDKLKKYTVTVTR